MTDPKQVQFDGEPQTAEGRRLMAWFVEQPGKVQSSNFFDAVAAVTLDHPDRDRLPAEEELEARMVEALKGEIGAMMTAPDESWKIAARSVITKLGLRPFDTFLNEFELRDHEIVFVMEEQ